MISLFLFHLHGLIGFHPGQLLHSFLAWLKSKLKDFTIVHFSMFASVSVRLLAFVYAFAFFSLISRKFLLIPFLHNSFYLMLVINMAA